MISGLAVLHSSIGVGGNGGPGEKSSEPNGRAEPPIDWVDGVAILIALSVLVRILFSPLPLYTLLTLPYIVEK